MSILAFLVFLLGIPSLVSLSPLLTSHDHHVPLISFICPYSSLPLLFPALLASLPHFSLSSSLPFSASPLTFFFQAHLDSFALAWWFFWCSQHLIFYWQLPFFSGQLLQRPLLFQHPLDQFGVFRTQMFQWTPELSRSSANKRDNAVIWFLSKVLTFFTYIKKTYTSVVRRQITSDPTQNSTLNTTTTRTITGKFAITLSHKDLFHWAFARAPLTTIKNIHWNTHKESCTTPERTHISWPASRKATWLNILYTRLGQ